VKEKLNRPE